MNDKCIMAFLDMEVSRIFVKCSCRRVIKIFSVIVMGVLPVAVFLSLYEEGLLLGRNSLNTDVFAKSKHQNTTIVAIALSLENESSVSTHLLDKYIESNTVPANTPSPISRRWNDNQPSKSDSISESVQPPVFLVTATTVNTSSNSVSLIEKKTLSPSQLPSPLPSQFPSPLPLAFIDLPIPLQTQHRIHRNITLIVQLRGELGNQLSVLANARITQLIAKTKYPHIHIQLIGQHQYSPKWTKGRDDLVKCFSKAFQNFEFSGGIYDKSGEFQKVQKLQQSWLNSEQLKKLENVRSFGFLDSLLLQQEQNASGIPIVPTSSVSKYSLPYLTATSFSWNDVIRNEGLYSEMRQWLEFNVDECCNPNVQPHENDIVFHFRNYVYELRRQKILASHFVEISPEILATVAFQNYTIRDHPRVAITSRFETGTDRYIQAFTERGISSYFVTGQRSGTEGFCFILQAKKETFGSYSSTYYRWAALLGNATLNRFYKIDASPVISSATVVNVTESKNKSFVVNDTSLFVADASLLRVLDTFVIGNSTVAIEVYRQLQSI